MNRLRNRSRWACVIVAAFALYVLAARVTYLVSAQEEKAVPALSEVQKLQLQNKLKDMELLQLKFEIAKQDLIAFVKSLERPGYDLDVQTGSYREKQK